MVAVGYTLMSEQTEPRQLVDYAVRAEEAGFDLAGCSDHNPGVLSLFDEAGGAGKPRYGQVAICYGPDEAECRKIVHDRWRWSSLGWPVMAELPGPRNFDAASQFVREEDVAKTVPCGPDIDRHVEAFKKFVDAGFTHVAVVQVGAEGQPDFLDWAQRDLLPRLREL